MRNNPTLRDKGDRIKELGIPRRNLALMVDPYAQMRTNKINKLLLHSKSKNPDFHDFTIDYPSIGEPDPFYESDFKDGTDGWNDTRGTITGNVDGIDGEDNVISFWADNSTDGHHYVFKSGVITENRIYRITGKVYIPSSNTNVNGVYVWNNRGSNGYIKIETIGSWVDFDFEINNTRGKTYLYITALKDGNTIFAGANSSSDDLFYVKDIKVQRVGLVASWQFDSHYNAQEGGGGYIGEDWARGGAVYSNELVANGFDWVDSNSDGLADDWHKGSGVVGSIVNGAQRVTYNSDTYYYEYRVFQEHIFETNKIYKISFKARANGAPITDGVNIKQGSSASRYTFKTIYPTSNFKQYDLYVYGQDVSTYGDVLNFEAVSAWTSQNDWFEIDDVSVKEISNGYHLIPSPGFDWQNQMTGDDPVYRNGNALEFDGVNDYAYIPAASAEAFNPGTGDFSMLIMFKTPFIDPYWNGIFTKGITASAPPNTYGFLDVNYYPNAVNFSISTNTGGSWAYSKSISGLSNGWHTAVFVRSGSDAYFYIDGALQDYQAGILAGIDLTNSYDLAIGALYNGARPINSSIVAAAYFNRALSAIEVSALSGKPKYWTWNETGTIANNNFKAVLSGGAELTQDIETNENNLYIEQKNNTTNYFGSVANHTITLDDGTWDYASIKEIMNIRRPSNFVEDFSKGGAAYGNELIANSGFENGAGTEADNWSFNNTSAGIRDIERVASEAHSGNYSVQYTASGNDGTGFYIYQAIPTEINVGDLVQVELWTYNKSNDGTWTLHIDENADRTYVFAYMSTIESGWTKHTKVFVAEYDYNQIVLSLNNTTNAEFYVDNISIKVISNGNHGLAQGGLETNQPIHPHAWEFDGVNDWSVFDLGNFVNIYNNDWIVCFWANAPLDQIETIIGSRHEDLNGHGNRWQIRLDDLVTFRLILHDGSTVISKDVDISDCANQRHFYSLVFKADTKQAEFYIDTVLKGTQDFSGLGEVLVQHFGIGGAYDNGSGSEYNNGLIDSVEWYLFDGQDSRASVMPSNYYDLYIEPIYKQTKKELRELGLLW